MAHLDNEIPSDETVVAVLAANGSMKPGALVSALGEFDRDDARRAILRCLNRGLIRLADDLSLEPVSQMAVAA